jgi:protein-disulfide isomerase
MKNMLVVTTCTAVLAAFPLLGGGAKKSAAPSVATVGGVAVTAEELDAIVGNRLMRVRTDEYNIRRDALEELITERLLKAEAQRRGTTVDDLLKAEVDAKIVTPAPSEVEGFYEGTKERFGNATKEEAVAQIIEGMRRQKANARLMEYHRELRDAANVRITLEPPRIALAVDGPARGKADAPVTIVEYSDFECPFCGRAAATVKKIESTYGDRVRIVFRDFPLPIHRGAPRAAEAAYCAGDQSKYWEMNERLFTKGGAISDADIRRFAAELRLDSQQFTQCLDSGKHTATWKAAHAEGLKIGVQSTPTFFVNGRMVPGAAPFEAFARIIDDELSRAGIARPKPQASAVATAR